MAYRIASFGLAAILSTIVVAQPMPDNVVTTTCTEEAQTTVWVDQFGHLIKPTGNPPAPIHPAPVHHAPVHAQDWSPSGQYKPLDYSNFQHGKFHHAPAPALTSSSSSAAPANTIPAKPAPVVEKPAPVVEKPVDTMSVHATEDTTKDTTTTPKTTTQSSGGGSGMGSGLSVIAGSEGTAQTIAQSADGKVGWYHNWQPNPTAGGVSDAQFCPMLHDTWGGDAGMWAGLWPAAAKGNYKCYLGQNEPDLTGQDAVSVARAFTDTFLKGLPTGGGVTIACPSFTSDTNPAKGLGWYKSFETACAGISGCSYNALQPHFYGYKAGNDNSAGQFAKGSSGWNYFTQFVQDVKTAAKGKKVWMTEYALGPSDGSAITSFTDQERAQFITDATEYLKGEIDAFSPYTVGPGGSNQMTSANDGLASAFKAAC